MKRALKFLKHSLIRHKLLGATLVVLVAGLILQLTKHDTAVHWLLSGFSIGAALTLLWGMWQDVRTGHYGINILGVVTIVAAVVLKQYWAALATVLMLTVTKILIDFAMRLAKSEARVLAGRAPKTAWLIHKGKTSEVKVSELKAGEKIMIKAGGLVPADAVILEGSGNFDESALTGDSAPQAKQAGDYLLSGSISLDGLITAKLTDIVEDSWYQQTIRLVRGASAAQATFVRLAERYNLPFTFLAVGIAVGAWVLSDQSTRFLDVLVVATPYALLAAVPIAFTGALARASRFGIIFKTGAALERLVRAPVIAFNKSGTLTLGQPRIDKVLATDSYNQAEVLQLAASLEQVSSHAIAESITAAAGEQKIKNLKVKNIKALTGLGLSAELKGKTILVGRLELMTASGITVPAKFKFNNDGTFTYVSLDNELVGAITLKDSPRPEAVASLKSLADMGKQTALLTGDSESTASKMAAGLDIQDVYAGLSPADKIHTIERFKPRPLVFVSSGISNVAALSAADVGTVLGARGSSAASEAANLIIMANSLSYVTIALSLAKRTLAIARQSMLAGTGLSLVLMILFATGRFSAIEGIVLQAIINTYMIFNALRAHSLSVDI